MTVGLEYRRDPDRSLLLSHTQANPIVQVAGTVTTVANTITNTPGTSWAAISYTGNKPICAIKPNFSGYLSYAAKVSSTYTWNWIIAAAVGTSIPYYVFDDATSVYTNVGLEIYDDAPGLPILFTSHPNFKPLRVVDVLTGLGTVTYPSGKTYAVAQGKFAGFRQWEPGAKNASHIVDPDWYAMIGYAEGIRLNNSTHEVELLGGGSAYRLDPASSAFDPGDPAPDYSLERSWTQRQVLVIDVTNY